MKLQKSVLSLKAIRGNLLIGCILISQTIMHTNGILQHKSNLSNFLIPNHPVHIQFIAPLFYKAPCKLQMLLCHPVVCKCVSWWGLMLRERITGFYYFPDHCIDGVEFIRVSQHTRPRSGSEWPKDQALLPTMVSYLKKK